MPKGIQIGIASETKAFKQGIDAGIIAPLEDAQKSLVDLGRDRSLDKLEGGLKDAQKATEDLGKETKETADAIEQEYRRSYSKMKASTKDAADDFTISSRQQTKLRKEAIQEIGNEAKANAAETFSSFDGSASSFVDGVQGTLGGLVSSLGPVGLALGAAGAAAIGVVNGLLAKGVETTDKFKERVGTLTAALVAAGDRSKVPLEQMVDRLKELEGKGDDAGNTLSSLRQAAKDTGIPFSALAQAYAGNTDAIKKYLPQLQEMSRATRESGDGASFFADAIQDGNDRTIDSSQRILKIVDEQRSELTSAAADAAFWAESGIPALQQKAKVIDTVNTAYDDAAGAAEDFVDKESGLFDVGKYLASMLAREKALRDYQETLATSPLSSDAKAFLTDQGEESAAVFLAGYKAATPAQQAELNRIWSEAGKANSGQYTAALKAGIPGTMPGPTITPHLDFTKADTDLQAFLTKRRADIAVGIVYRNGKPVI